MKTNQTPNALSVAPRVCEPASGDRCIVDTQSPKLSRDTPTAEGMLTPKEYAQAQKVSLSWLAKARKRGDGPPFVRFGRSVRYFPLKRPD